MSDDLISRKALIENLNRFAPEHYSALVNDLIVKQPTAFDQEMVIAEIRKRFETCDGKRCEEYSTCDKCRSEEAVKIVKKGGIE